MTCNSMKATINKEQIKLILIKMAIYVRVWITISLKNTMILL